MRSIASMSQNHLFTKMFDTDATHCLKCWIYYNYNIVWTDVIVSGSRVAQAGWRAGQNVRNSACSMLVWKLFSTCQEKKPNKPRKDMSSIKIAIFIGGSSPPFFGCRSQLHCDMLTRPVSMSWRLLPHLFHLASLLSVWSGAGFQPGQDHRGCFRSLRFWDSRSCPETAVGNLALKLKTILHQIKFIIRLICHMKSWGLACLQAYYIITAILQERGHGLFDHQMTPMMVHLRYKFCRILNDLLIEMQRFITPQRCPLMLLNMCL